MAITPKPVKPVPNWDILNAIRNVATNDYQRRIPAANKANVTETMRLLEDNPPQRNEFINALVNRVGLVVGYSRNWENPLSIFKKGWLRNGDTIEEVMVGLLQEKAYDENRDYLEKDIWGQERPEVQSSFHKINRKGYYKITINEVALRRAFLPGDDYSLYSFIDQLMQTAEKSDNVDEFLYMTQLLTEYEANGGFFKVNVPDAGVNTSTSADTNPLLRQIRAWSSRLKFVSRQYNAARMPVAASPDELILLLTPDVDAALDVESLAAAFNIDRADVYVRKIVVPEEAMPTPETQAILTTEDFFQVYDVLYETREAVNPVGLYSNYFLHHHQVISASRFVPAVAFTTEAGTVIESFDPPATSVTAITVLGEDSDGDMVTVTDVERGGTYMVEAEGVTTPAGGQRTAVVLSIDGATSFDTVITNNGALYVGIREEADELTIRATSTDSGDVTTTSVRVVEGDRAQVWPNPQIIEDVEEDPEP